MLEQIQHIRQAYITNPHWGVALWFAEFDKAVRKHEFSLCHTLLREAFSTNYSFTENEYAYIESREGALLLCEGIHHHKQGHYALAVKMYEASRKIQRHLQHLDGEGQVIFAQQELRITDRESDQTLLDAIFSQPKVVGSGDMVLEKRFEQAEVSEQLRIVVAAKHCGFPLALYKALRASEEQIQGAAAAALAWLDPGPDYTTLMNMLTSSFWMVRWQAAAMLLQRARKQPQEFAQQQALVHDTVAQQLTTGEVVLPALRTIVSLLPHITTVSDTPLLVKLLADPDPEVLMSVIDLLGQVGDRRALPALTALQDDSTSASQSMMSEIARAAVKAIEERYSQPLVHSVIFCRKLDAQKQPVQPSRKFFKHVPIIHCVVTILYPMAGCQVTCSLQENEQEILYQEQTIPASSPDKLYSNLVEEVSDELPVQNPTIISVQVVKPPRIMPYISLVFSFPIPAAGWVRAKYTAQIAIDEGDKQNYSFEIDDRPLPQLDAYRLIQLLGKSSFAQTYLGEHTIIQEESAIKVFKPVHLSNEEREGFILKVRTISRLTHPQIIKLFGYGIEDGPSSDSILYLVMEYVPDGSLRKRHPRNDVVQPASVALYITQAAIALQYVHDRGIVHGNLNPENLLVSSSKGWGGPSILLSDFAMPGTRRTKAETKGYVEYMAPEQFSGEVSYASDQYSLGIMTYEWLTASYPFEGTPEQIVQHHLNATLLPLRRVAPQISTELEAVVMKALAKEPEQRYPSVMDFAVALESAANMSAAPAPQDARIGQILGNYRLTQLLGSGGFARVYLGIHQYLQSKAAIKVINELSLSSEAQEDFLREVRTIDSLNHPNIVKMLGHGLHADPQYNTRYTPFIIMEFAPRGTMRQHYHGTALSLQEVVRYLRQVAGALQYAHDQGVLHLDIKPDNMLLDSSNNILLSDFGTTAMVPENNLITITVRIAGIKGTPAYMAPEQLTGRTLRKATDQYSLGIVVYEWLTGARPFEGDQQSVISMQINTPPPRFRDVNPNLSIPSSIESAVMKALSKDPDARFPEVKDFVEAIDPSHANQIWTWRCSLGHENPIGSGFCDECGEPESFPVH